MPRTPDPQECNCPCHKGVRLVLPFPCCRASGHWLWPKKKEKKSAEMKKR